MGLINFIRNGITIQKNSKPAAPVAAAEITAPPAEKPAVSTPQAPAPQSVKEDRKTIAGTILYSAEPPASYVAQPMPFMSSLNRSEIPPAEPQNNFGNAFQNALGGQTIGNNNILVITPRSKDEIMKVAKSLGDGNSCILSLASITEPQRHLDFLEGFLCASGGTIQQIDISKYVLTPKGVSIRS